MRSLQYGVATQMGNQGSAASGPARAVELFSRASFSQRSSCLDEPTHRPQVILQGAGGPQWHWRPCTANLASWLPATTPRLHVHWDEFRPAPETIRQYLSSPLLVADMHCFWATWSTLPT